MTTEIQQQAALAAPDTPSKAAAKAAQPVDALAQSSPHKPKRTLGLWLVDTLIYPIVNNFGVFGISVFATYLTEHGWPKPANGSELAGWKQKIGDVFQSRGKKLDAFLEESFGWSKKAAGMSRMVFFSFFDGTFVAPFVKVLEDRRERMAQSIDTLLGTKPKDERVYEAEPKQSWRSVIEGRVLTSLIVVPTAVLLSRKNVAGESLNDFLFNNPGLKRGEQIESSMPKLKAGLEKVFGKVNLPFFAKTVYFEAFYTSVCTAGLYLISRTVARKHPKKESPAIAHATPKVLADQKTTAREEAPAEMLAEKPTANISQPMLLERVAQPQQTAELTA